MQARASFGSLSRLGSLALTLVLGVPTACDKGGGTTDPDGGGDGGETKGSGVEFAYSNTFTLDGQISVDFSNESPEGPGAAKIVAKTRIEATPSGAKTKIHGKVVELVEYTGTGTLDPEFMKQQMAKQPVPEGETAKPEFDLVAALRSSEDWLIVDAHGEADDEATKALPENAAEEAGMGAGDFGLFNLPDLPKVQLEIGKPVTLPTAEKDEAMFGQTIPVETDQTWTLVSVGDKDGRKVATLEVKSESSGATEVQGGGGGGMLAIGTESTFTIEFDLDAKLPISLSGESMFELAFDGGGQSISFQNTSKIEATYSVAPAN